MKVQKIKQILECAKDDDNVMIAVKMPYVTAGAIPMVPVRFAFTGFDWEKGNFVITPDENLTPADRDFAQQMKELQDKLGHALLENRRLKAENKKLKMNLE